MISDDMTTAPRAADPARARAEVRTTRLVALGSLALLVVGAMAWAPWQVRWNPDFSIALPPANDPTTPPPTADPQPVDVANNDVVLWIVIGLGLVVLAILTVVAARVVRAWWSRRPRPVPEAPLTVDAMPGQVVPTREVVADAVADALARLDGTPDAADAVVHAWLALEEAVAREGIVREAAQTQAELTAEVLHATHAPADATRTLLRTYEAVRYGSAGASRADVRTARGALEAILVSMRDDVKENG
ncbi:DUF4129 domain-containing protein [Sanguibacter sp. A247]|uniref:DUF4129 domain-containing protein n=1 Tax=unclassified Sanguibacter TaxID=2645534 RepID=UPI003FD72AA6